MFEVRGLSSEFSRVLQSGERLFDSNRKIVLKERRTEAGRSLGRRKSTVFLFGKTVDVYRGSSAFFEAGLKGLYVGSIGFSRDKDLLVSQQFSARQRLRFGRRVEDILAKSDFGVAGGTMLSNTSLTSVSEEESEGASIFLNSKAKVLMSQRGRSQRRIRSISHVVNPISSGDVFTERSGFDLLRSRFSEVPRNCFLGVSYPHRINRFGLRGFKPFISSRRGFLRHNVKAPGVSKGLFFARPGGIFFNKLYRLKYVAMPRSLRRYNRTRRQLFNKLHILLSLLLHTKGLFRFKPYLVKKYLYRLKVYLKLFRSYFLVRFFKTYRLLSMSGVKRGKKVYNFFSNYLYNTFWINNLMKVVFMRQIFRARCVLLNYFRVYNTFFRVSPLVSFAKFDVLRTGAFLLERSRFLGFFNFQYCSLFGWCDSRAFVLGDRLLSYTSLLKDGIGDFPFIRGRISRRFIPRTWRNNYMVPRGFVKRYRTFLRTKRRFFFKFFRNVSRSYFLLMQKRARGSFLRCKAVSSDRFFSSSVGTILFVLFFRAFKDRLFRRKTVLGYSFSRFFGLSFAYYRAQMYPQKGVGISSGVGYRLRGVHLSSSRFSLRNQNRLLPFSSVLSLYSGLYSTRLWRRKRFFYLPSRPYFYSKFRKLLLKARGSGKVSVLCFTNRFLRSI
jgi:hypothetical protein